MLWLLLLLQVQNVNQKYFMDDIKLVRIRLPRAVFGDKLLRTFDLENARAFGKLHEQVNFPTTQHHSRD